MFRRNLFLLIVTVAISTIASFFILSLVKAAPTTINIITKHTGNINSFSDWIYTNCSQGAPSGDNYIVMTNNTSTLISPIIDLNGYENKKINFKARTYGAVTSNMAEITISISTDNGSTWNLISTTTPTTASLVAQPTINLTNYNGQIKIKFETLSAVSSKGAGLDEIDITGNLPNKLPIALIKLNTTTANIGDIINFDGEDSTDTDGFINNYSWNFGDDNTAVGTTTVHDYATSGTFAIILTVTDDSNATSTTSSLITIYNNSTSSLDSSTTSTINFHDLVINEFVSDPTSGNLEWVEIYNNTTSSIDLNGLIINDGSGATTTVATTTDLIAPNDFFVISEIKGNLNNTGDLIVLKDASGNIIDQVAYGIWNDGNVSDNAPVASDGNATARNTDGLSTGNDQNDFSITTTPTPGQINNITAKQSGSGSSNNNTTQTTTTEKKVATTTSTTTPKIIATTSVEKIIVTSTDIIINELLPNPSDDEATKEFIELKNIGNIDINLKGWQLSDNSNKKYTFSSSTIIIKAGSFLVIYRSVSQIALNNTGIEAVNLIAPNNKLIDRVEYSGPTKEDYAYARDEKNHWAWTSTVTPGAENIFANTTIQNSTANSTTKKVKASTVSAGTINISLEEVRNLENNQKVKVTGVVSVEPGLLGTQIFYLAGSGIQIYCNKKDFPALKVGDTIEVNGVLSESGGERRIKITTAEDIKILNGGPEPTPHEVTTGEIDENLEGSLVQINGEVIEIKGTSIYLDDGSGEARIYIKSTTGMNQKDLNIKTGDKLQITGIVSQTSAGYRILPRYARDIIKVGESAITAQPQNVEKNQNYSWLVKYLVAVIVFLIIVVSWVVYIYVWKKKKK
ncbi:MAG: lamin tail domain-containing protein [bacterium]